jgi:hypothetical protein
LTREKENSNMESVGQRGTAVVLRTSAFPWAVLIAGHFSSRRGRDLIRCTPCAIAENIGDGNSSGLELGMLRESSSWHQGTGWLAYDDSTTRQMPPWYGIVCRGSESTLQNYHEQHSTAFLAARNGAGAFQVQQGHSNLEIKRFQEFAARSGLYSRQQLQRYDAPD